MIIPTTLIDVSRLPTSDAGRERYSGTEGDYVPQFSGVNADLQQPHGITRYEGEEQKVDYMLKCDLIDLQQWDLITDRTTGSQFTVQWVRPERRLGFDHIVAGVAVYSGAL